MNKTTKFAVLLALVASAGARGEMDTGTIDGGTTKIYGGRVYTVSGDFSISADAGKSALTVEPGSGTSANLVVINVPHGRTLTLKGGDANGRTGAGAGIMLPNDMTLYITGEGTLKATGGNAADGGNGGAGADSSKDGDKLGTRSGGAGDRKSTRSELQSRI